MTTRCTSQSRRWTPNYGVELVVDTFNICRSPTASVDGGARARTKGHLAVLLTFLMLAPLAIVASAPAAANGHQSGTGTSVEIALDSTQTNTGEFVNWTLIVTRSSDSVNTFGNTIEIDMYVYAGYSSNGTMEFQNTTTYIVGAGTHNLSGQSIPGFAIWNGTYEYTVRVEVRGGNGATTSLANDEKEMIIFRDTVPPSPTKFIVFGDSLSDMGNAYNSIARVPQSPPYWNGRFSDGPVWAELVSQQIGLTIASGGGSSSNTNRAYGGARSGGGYTSFVIPNTGTQVNEYTNNHWIQQTDLSVIWIGGNDFIGGGQQNPQVVVDNIANHVTVLNQNGGQQFLILDMPSLEKTPNYADESESNKQAMHARVIDYNSRLANDMAALETSLSIDINVVGMLNMFESIYWNDSFYGITNPSEQACHSGDGLCEQGDYIVPNPEEYIFFDGLHPTATVQRLIADYVLEQIGSPDLDGDGVADVDDNCPETPIGDSVNHFGCRLADLDSDNDGVNDLLDWCPGTASGASVDENGCAENQKDTDGDGVTDDIDLCPQTNSGFGVDEDGCADYQKDTDNDGVTDDVDICPGTDAGATVNDIGCADNQLDMDWDGVMNDVDLCQSTPLGEAVDENGCSDTQLDTDLDGVNNALDLCPNTPQNEPVDANGCSPSQKDGDLDGVSDALDECPLTMFAQEPDERGCSAAQRDTDGDGRMDDADECVTIPGSIRGCPKLFLEYSILRMPQSFDETAEIQVEHSCESSCITRLLVDGEWHENLSNGTESFEIGPYDGMHGVEIRLEAMGTSVWARKDLAVTWPEEPAAPPVIEERPDETTDEPAVGAGNSNNEAASEGWIASQMVQVLMAVFFMVLIMTILVAIVRQTRHPPSERPWADPTALSTFEVEREMRTNQPMSQPVAANFTPPPVAEQPVEQPVEQADEQSANSAGYEDIPSIGDLFG